MYFIDLDNPSLHPRSTITIDNNGYYNSRSAGDLSLASSVTETGDIVVVQNITSSNGAIVTKYKIHIDEAIHDEVSPNFVDASPC